MTAVTFPRQRRLETKERQIEQPFQTQGPRDRLENGINGQTGVLLGRAGRRREESLKRPSLLYFSHRKTKLYNNTSHVARNGRMGVCKR
jgi:hypothetical protein